MGLPLLNGSPAGLKACLRHRRWGAAVVAAALSFGLAGCGSAPPPTFDLSAARDFGKLGTGRGALAVGEPVAVQVLNSDRVIVNDGGALSFVGGAQWADRLPALIQTRLIETFENGSRLASVGRPNSSLNAPYLLSSELRAFQIEAAGRTALVEITARLLTSSGQVLSARLFKAEVPVTGAIDGAGATRALNEALQKVLVDIVRWASS